MLRWQYAVTSVDTRAPAIVSATLESLVAGGFERSTLFVDTHDDDRVGAFGNWIRAAWITYLKNPHADRYCIFQDDILVVDNLKEILEATPIQDKQYLNLYTVESNDRGSGNIGWHPARVYGQGALGLVFTNKGIRDLLVSPEIVNHPKTRLGDRNIDGTIATALGSLGYTEMCHTPSLLSHTGKESTIGTKDYPKEVSDWSASATRYAVPREFSTILDDSGPRIGFVGYNVMSGLGEKSRQITKYLPIANWLIHPHGGYDSSKYQPTCSHIMADKDDTFAVEAFVQSVDVVLFDESPLYPSLLDACKRHSKRVVCIPAIEWLPESGWPEQIDLFICPTEQCYHMLNEHLPCVCFPWPVDTARFKFKQRSICNRFLFCHGQGGIYDRKGGNVLQASLEIWPEMPVSIRTQRPDLWKGREVLGQVDHNYQLYEEGDVLISPHSVDGTGLEHMEAMACGMPVITTNGEPWNEVPALARVNAGITLKHLGRDMPWFLPDPQHLVDICKEWLGEDISITSKIGRQWAESRSFDQKAEQLKWLVQYGTI